MIRLTHARNPSAVLTVRMVPTTNRYNMPMRARAMRAVLLATLAASSCSAVDRTRLYASAKAPKDDSAKIEPRLKLSCAVRPCIKLRKSIEALGTTLSFGADYHVREKEAHFETTWHDPRLGGQLSLRDLSRLEWRKTWLFPGLADAATRVEVRSTLDLRTAQPDVRLKLGLRRSFASSGMSFVQDVPLDGSDGHCKVSVGATLTVREQGHTAQWQCPSSAPTPPQGTPGGSRTGSEHRTPGNYPGGLEGAAGEVTARSPMSAGTRPCPCFLREAQ